MIINNTICFIHIPKAGGSTIEHLLIQNETNYINYIILIIIEFIYDIIKTYASVLYYIFSNHNDGLLRTINDYFLNNYHSSYIDYKTKYDSYESYSNTKNINIKYFSCVRHPQSRLVSLYTFLKPPINFDTFVIQLLSKKNNDINNNDINNNDINNKTNKKNTYPPQISYQEQSLFLCDKFNKLCVPYIKIENINTDWEKMCIYLNISHYKNDSNKNTIPYKNVSERDTNTMNWKLYYDKYPHIINYVKDYYKNDFINFNYDIYYPNIYINKI